MSRLVSIALALSVAVVLLAPGAGAQPADEPWTTEQMENYRQVVEESAWDVPEDLTDRASELLFQEIALLARLDAFAGGGDLVVQVDQAFAPLDGASRETLLLALESVDADLAWVKSSILPYTNLSPPVTVALDDLDPTWKTALRNGAAGVVPVQPYVSALGTLLSRGTAAQLGPDRGIEMTDLGPTLVVLVDGSELSDLTGVDPAISPIDGEAGLAGTGQSLTGVVILGSVGVIVGALLIALLRRRRGVVAGHDLSTVIRHLIGAADERDVERIAVGEAVRLTGAAGGLLLRADEMGVRRAGSSERIHHSRIVDAIRAGARVNEIVEADPALGGVTASVLAAPVVNRGVVIGLLVLHHPPDESFSADDRHVLDRLAPPVGAALANVDRLDSVTELTLVDELTSLGNRRRMDRDLLDSVASAEQHGSPIAFAMVDVDHFKVFNDTHGHTAGDTALQAVARTIATTVREADIVYRYGGEEFSILLPGATSIEAGEIAERVRRAVEAVPIPGEQTQPGGRLTVSVGVSTLPSSDPSAIAIRADQALYDAKVAGRNRVVLT